MLSQACRAEGFGAERALLPLHCLQACSCTHHGISRRLDGADLEAVGGRGFSGTRRPELSLQCL